MAQPDSLVGTLFAKKYRIIRLLGTGGFANVYLAEDTFLKRDVAIKIFKRPLDVSTQQAMLREAQILIACKHPHIVQLYDVNVTNIDGKEIIYIVMQYAPNGCVPRGKLPIPHIANILSQTGDALEAVHAQGIVHRDLKQGNILMGVAGNILLSDFGIARQAHSVNPDVTIEDQLIGTPAYMAPEQAHGDVSRASDVYAMGVIVYEMMTGSVPFQGDLIHVLLQHAKDAVPSFVSRGVRMTAVTKRIETVVLKALAKEKKERYESVKAFSLAFLEAVKGYVPSLPEDALPLAHHAKVLLHTDKETDSMMSLTGEHILLANKASMSLMES